MSTYPPVEEPHPPTYEEARARLAMALTIDDGPKNFTVVLRQDLWVLLEETRGRGDDPA